MASKAINQMKRLGIVLVGAVSLNGCGTTLFSSRDTNPVIQDYAIPAPFSFKRSTNIFATTASRRLAIFTEDRNGKVLTCAEPPPDVGEAFASAVAAGLQAAGTATDTSGNKVSAELATQYGRAVATQIAPLLYRTQGLQIYRDSIYKLCIDRMNEWITQEKYEAETRYRFDEALKKISEELPVMKEAVTAFYTNVKAGDAKVNVSDIVKVLEAQKK